MNAQQTPEPGDNPKPPVSEREVATKPEPEPREHGGPKGPDPTRYGDWERNGRCYDF